MILFVRHAAAECMLLGRPLLCGRHDVRLSREGQSQLHPLRQRLSQEYSLDAAYVSPLRRALETATAIPEPLRERIRILRSLAEIDCGNLEGMPISEVQQRFPKLCQENEAQQNENFSWPGGETYRQFRRRVLRAVKTIARRHEGQRVLVVTHAGVINQVLGTICGQSSAHWQSPRPRNASITGVHWAANGATLRFFDDCSHLETVVPPVSR